MCLVPFRNYDLELRTLQSRQPTILTPKHPLGYSLNWMNTIFCNIKFMYKTGHINFEIGNSLQI